MLALEPNSRDRVRESCATGKLLPALRQEPYPCADVANRLPGVAGADRRDGEAHERAVRGTRD